MFERRAIWETILLVDVYGISSDDEGLELYEIVKQYANVITTQEHKFQPQGLTKVAILSESHLALHTYPEASVATITFSTCSEDGATLTQQLIEQMKELGYTFSYKVLQRGRHGIKCILSGDSCHGEEATKTI